MFTRLFNTHSWPGQCLVCRAWPAQTVCTRCAGRFLPRIPRCERCALPVPEGVVRCGACLTKPPPVDRCLVATSWQWPWTSCIARLKFQQDVGLAAPLATLLARTPGVAIEIGRAHWLLPMPLAPQRLAERGYNPALLLARQLARQRWRDDLLLRTRHTPPQRGLPRVERLRNVRGAFAVDPELAEQLRGRRVVLLDDVMTTGASMYEAAHALRRAGVREITALAFARADASH